MFDKIRSMLKSKEKSATEFAEKKLKNVDPHRTAVYDDYIIGTDAFKDRWVTGGAKETPNKTLAYKDRIYHYYAPQKAWGIFEEKTLIFDLNTGMYIGAMTSDYIDTIRRVNSEEEKVKQRVNDLLHAATLPNTVLSQELVDSLAENSKLIKADGKLENIAVSNQVVPASYSALNTISEQPVSLQTKLTYHQAKKIVTLHENFDEIDKYLEEYPLKFDTNLVELVATAPDETCVVKFKVTALKPKNQGIKTVVTLKLLVEHNVATLTRKALWYIDAKDYFTGTHGKNLPISKGHTFAQLKYGIDRPTEIVNEVMKLLDIPVPTKNTEIHSYALEWKEVATSEYIPVDEPLLVYYGAEESAGLPAYMTEAVLCSVTGEWKSQTQEQIRKITHWALQPVSPIGLQINQTQQLL